MDVMDVMGDRTWVQEDSFGSQHYNHNSVIRCEECGLQQKVVERSGCNLYNKG